MAIVCSVIALLVGSDDGRSSDPGVTFEIKSGILLKYNYMYIQYNSFLS